MRLTLCLLASALALASSLAHAQSDGALRSSHLAAPETLLPIIVQSADFWKPAYDDQFGGFFSEVDLSGQPTSNDKAVLSQSRNAYAMVKAFMISGDEEYLAYADGALRFMYEFGWDADNPGWHGALTRTGELDNNPPWPNNGKWSFWQHYMLLGIGVMVEATADSFHNDWLALGNQVNDEFMWDDRPGFEGYYHRANESWTQPERKGFTPTVDAITTNSLRNYLLTRSEFRRQRLEDVADNIVDHLLGAKDNGNVRVSFPSEFDADWVVNNGSEITSIGHHIKTGWCLARAYLILGEDRFRHGFVRLFDETWWYGQGDPAVTPMFNREVGYPYNQVNWQTGEVTDTISDWWTIEQAFTGPIMGWYVTRKPEYLAMADGALAFFMDHYYDYEKGEVFSRVREDGVVTSAAKGDMFKAGYHSIELFYLAYLYGNLYLHNRPVELFYRFTPTAEDRAISLWPLAFPDGDLVILDVERDGTAISTFDRDRRTLNVAAGEGGTYKVTFASRYPFNFRPHTARGWIDDNKGEVYYNLDWYPWVFTADHGWLYAFPRTAHGFWLWSSNEDLGYLFTSNTLYPLAYSTAQGAWVDLADN